MSSAPTHLRPARSAAGNASTSISWAWITPKRLLILAAVLLLATFPFAAWSLLLKAPQYPGGLRFTIYPTYLAGDVAEIDELNHYIGMAKLGEVAQLERVLWPFALPIMALLALLPAFIHRRWIWLTALLPFGYPVVFAIDMYARLYQAGHTLDSHAALSSSVKPFTPPLFGDGAVGQFHTVASFGPGYYLAVAASIAIAAAYVLHRRAAAEG